MLTDVAGLCVISVVIGNSVPIQHQFSNDKAWEGLLLGRKALAKAFDVPIDHVQFLPQGNRFNMDNMVCIYSAANGVSIVNEERGLVLKDEVNGQTNSTCFSW